MDRAKEIKVKQRGGRPIQVAAKPSSAGFARGRIMNLSRPVTRDRQEVVLPSNRQKKYADLHSPPAARTAF